MSKSSAELSFSFSAGGSFALLRMIARGSVLSLP